MYSAAIRIPPGTFGARRKRGVPPTERSADGQLRHRGCCAGRAGRELRYGWSWQGSPVLRAKAGIVRRRKNQPVHRHSRLARRASHEPPALAADHRGTDHAQPDGDALVGPKRRWMTTVARQRDETRRLVWVIPSRLPGACARQPAESASGTSRFGSICFFVPTYRRRRAKPPRFFRVFTRDADHDGETYRVARARFFYVGSRRCDGMGERSPRHRQFRLARLCTTPDINRVVAHFHPGPNTIVARSK